MTVNYKMELLRQFCNAECSFPVDSRHIVLPLHVQRSPAARYQVAALISTHTRGALKGPDDISPKDPRALLEIEARYTSKRLSRWYINSYSTASHDLQYCVFSSQLSIEHQRRDFNGRVNGVVYLLAREHHGLSDLV